MNYTRRPNRPDGNVYREMRRQKFRKPRNVNRGGGARGAMLPAGVVIVVLVCMGIVGWVLWQ